jgi:hypothetical protein
MDLAFGKWNLIENSATTVGKDPFDADEEDRRDDEDDEHIYSDDMRGNPEVAIWNSVLRTFAIASAGPRVSSSRKCFRSVVVTGEGKPPRPERILNAVSAISLLTVWLSI